MNHPTMEELTEAVHGLAPRPPHVDGCDECRSLVARLENELRVLRLADARLSPPPARASRLAWLPVAAAAAVLLAIVAVIILRPVASPDMPAQEPPPPPTIEELIAAFLNGSDEAGAAIERRGQGTLRALSEARLKHVREARRPNLDELRNRIKFAGWTTKDASAMEGKLRSTQLSISFDRQKLTVIVDYVRGVTGWSFAIDPAAKIDQEVTIRKESCPALSVLDDVTSQCSLDYDLRYGVLWLAAPDRLWCDLRPKAPAPLSDSQAQAAREWVRQLAAETLEERDAAATELRKLGPAVLPFLQEGTGSDDAEGRARCKELLGELSRRDAEPPLPAANAWARQDLKGDNAAIAEKLRSMKITLAFQDIPLAVFADYLRSSFGLQIVCAGADGETPFSATARDLELSHVLELATLPHGLDARIENGAVVIFKRE